MQNTGSKLIGMTRSKVKVFEGLQCPIPEGLDHWYELRVDRIIGVSVDPSYQCTNKEPIKENKIIVFEPNARWSEFRDGARCRCRILAEREITLILASL